MSYDAGSSGAREYSGRRRVVWGTVLLGLGLGGFFDGIVLHQILQWHHMVTSAGYPADTVENLELNTLLDGLFHTSTYIMTGVGLGLLWSATRLPHVRWSTTLLIGGAGRLGYVQRGRRHCRSPHPRSPPRQRRFHQPVGVGPRIPRLGCNHARGTRACRVRRIRRAESGRHAEALPRALGEGQYLI